ncbi:MAG: tetratricopeptide repeat protein [Sphingomonas sp.]
MLSSTVMFTGAAAVEIAKANPPLGWPADIGWAWTSPNPLLLLTAALAGLSAWASIVQLTAPKAATASDIVRDGRKTRVGVEHLSRQVAAEGQQSDRQHERTQASIDDLHGKIDALQRSIASKSPDQAEAIGKVFGELLGSGRQEDIAVVETAVDQGPQAAADALIEAANAGKQRNAERFRQAARLYAPFEPGKAKAAYEEAVQLDPTDVWSWIELGRLRLVYDGIDAARRCTDIALQHVTDERDRGVLEDELGDIELRLGNLGRARERYAAGLAIAEQRAAREPGNSLWQRDVSVSRNKLGDIEVAAGNLGAARERYAASLAIAEQLAARDPGNSEWQRDLSVSHNKLGDIEVAAGNLTAASERYAAGLAIRERLAAREPGNSLWQRDLWVSHEKLGDIEMAAGNLGAARERYAAGLAIREQRAAREPGNSEWQRDLWASNGKLGQLAETEGDREAAIDHYRRAEAIMSALVERWPDHPGFAKDLAHVRGDIARVEAALKSAS